jgi:hypothetical protein
LGVSNRNVAGWRDASTSTLFQSLYGQVLHRFLMGGTTTKWDRYGVAGVMVATSGVGRASYDQIHPAIAASKPFLSQAQCANRDVAGVR